MSNAAGGKGKEVAAAVSDDDGKKKKAPTVYRAPPGKIPARAANWDSCDLEDMGMPNANAPKRCENNCSGCPLNNNKA